MSSQGDCPGRVLSAGPVKLGCSPLQLEGVFPSPKLPKPSV